MTELLRFPTDVGQFVIVEVDETEPGFERATRGGGIAQAKKKFEDALQDVRDAAESALRVFTRGTLRPDGVEVEFGVRLNAEAGAIIAKTSVEGHLAVKLIWQRESRQLDQSDDDPQTAQRARV